MYIAQAPSCAVPVASVGVDTTQAPLSIGATYRPAKSLFVLAVLVLLALALGYSGLALLGAFAAIMGAAAGWGGAVTSLQVFETGLVITKRQGALGDGYEAYELPWAMVERLSLDQSRLLIVHNDERLRSLVGSRLLFFPREEGILLLHAELTWLKRKGALRRAFKSHPTIHAKATAHPLANLRLMPINSATTSGRA
ncbi:hypothetical protein [Variovorax sp. KK3]|uniref:hypothetical protein n=1 Tax=Variovorax sp. KK3 TaxID=1855728 RepID=UPI00097C8137|nr:hypothetical protein [Variovorax sp. KK3]